MASGDKLHKYVLKYRHIHVHLDVSVFLDAALDDMLYLYLIVDKNISSGMNFNINRTLDKGQS